MRIGYTMIEIVNAIHLWGCQLCEEKSKQSCLNGKTKKNANRFLFLEPGRWAKHIFPVGKVENLYLYPLDFEEYLLALGEERLADEIRAYFRDLTAMPEPLHKKAIELNRCYLITV